MTVRELISSAMKKFGALAAGETATADEASDGMSALNLMLDSFSNESLVIYTHVREEFATVASQSSRTIGTGGNFSTTRPINIERAGMEDSSGNEQPIKILNQDEWAAITSKALTSESPSAIYYEPTNPLGTIYFWPVPTGTNNLVLYSWKPLTTFTSLSTSLTFPPGYEEMLVFNLALRWAPDFDKQVSPEVSEVARETKAQLKRINFKPQLMETDPALLSNGYAYNIFAGE